MSAGRRARGGVSFAVRRPPNPPRHGNPALAIAISVAVAFLAIFGGLHLLGRIFA